MAVQFFQLTRSLVGVLTLWMGRLIITIRHTLEGQLEQPVLLLMHWEWHPAWLATPTSGEVMRRIVWQEAVQDVIKI